MKLAVLRVDGNFHDYYQDALYHGLPEELTRIDIYIYIQAISERLVVSPWTSRKCGLHTCNMHNSAQHFREMRNMFVQDSADAGCLFGSDPKAIKICSP